MLALNPPVSRAIDVTVRERRVVIVRAFVKKTQRMQQAIAEAEQRRRRQAAFEQLTEARPSRPALTDAVARAARESGRP
ncbi:hypothetical protein [Thiocapsa rosea]|uniref:hypothetical protein n=1 Tax=Thiocapsa rosea TaxID=69360 RepID=UPI000EB3113D|nr:hypothetical protein [Thiocapsa rosea]